MKTFITTAEAAGKLGITPRRVRALIESGRLPAEKRGRDYLISAKSLSLVTTRKPGRPTKRKS